MKDVGKEKLSEAGAKIGEFLIIFIVSYWLSV
jgi:hypothetical protein